MEITDTVVWKVFRNELRIEGIRTDNESVETIIRLAGAHISRMRGEIQALMFRAEKNEVLYER